MALGLYDPSFEHDACGVGFVAHRDGSASHAIVELGLQILKSLVHRGAFGSDPETGDGAGLLLQIPADLFRAESTSWKFNLPEPKEYGVGMVFLPKSGKERLKCQRIIEESARREGLKLLGWRDVAVDSSKIGRQAAATEPVIAQFFIGYPTPREQDDFERQLFVLRKVIESEVHSATGISNDHVFSICSLSSRTIVYKGLLLPHQVDRYYADLQNPLFRSAVALVHQRFSTNTLPAWPLAHPYRFLAHNGEINTIQGNRAWMHAREKGITSTKLGDNVQKLFPLVSPEGSDSGSLDNAVELLVYAGMTLPQALMVLVPEAWERHEEMPAPLKDFYAYHNGVMEPWDGPASICFSDGRCVGGILDRNGLRPARYTITRDGLVVYASETGVIEFEPDQIEHLGRLRPGELFLLDLEQGRIIPSQEVKLELAAQHPYGQWLADGQVDLGKCVQQPLVDQDEIDQQLLEFSYSLEDVDLLLRPMATNGEEPLGSMGNDTPSAPFSHKPQLLFNYFRQLFAQVTNPAIDPIREALVMSLADSIGQDGSLLETTAANARQIRLESPVLTEAQIEELKLMPDRLTVRTLRTTFNPKETHGALDRSLRRICREASIAVDEGVSVLLLSDRDRSDGQIPVPSLLAVSAVHHHLTLEGVRAQVALIVDSGEPREVHHFACLLAYGASAVCPYLALSVSRSMNPTSGEKNFIKAVGKGLQKVMSKMGISTLRSYRGSQLLEAIGLSDDLVEEYFTGTPSRIGGLNLDDIEREAKLLYTLEKSDLPIGGVYQWRRLGEYHAFNPTSITLLQQSVREENFETFEAFTEAVHCSEDYACEIRSLLEVTPTRPAVKLHEVESAKEIVKRFATGAMSLGSISRESHESLAIAMNAIGGKSNTGEGGEDPERFLDNRRSSIKQVASGRFGVTTSYLVNADELQIKVAQGAKPGEGGQLPGSKVDEYIARIRHTTPKVTLISPPPHHDIYSIEDLAQLIYDLRSVNSEARISVKLVAAAGIGTVAAGVVKADADHILVSGAEGGTGASPVTSIRHAGLPWELGLAETQQTLVRNGLRSRIRIQVDGQMKTGRDVVIGALLGADEFGFATAPLVAQGCIMMRVCHLGTCPVGIATQDPELRKRFEGKPEHVINYFFFIAEQVRRYMAELGYRTFAEMVGQVQDLQPSRGPRHWKTRALDFSKILYRETPRTGDGVSYHPWRRTFTPTALENGFIAEIRRAVEAGRSIHLDARICNSDRSFGAFLSGQLVRWGGKADISISLHGSAGQSFGGFLVDGLSLSLIGDANDYVGKGMSGGLISIRLPAGTPVASNESVIAGNTVLYGATSGRLFLAGCAGERFAVRNSGATAVVEGVGDHAAEYMTGGRIVVLGDFGRNFGAGMSGGVAYVYDPDRNLDKRMNRESGLLREELFNDAELLGLIAEHIQHTGSTYAQGLLDHWETIRGAFVRIIPEEYKRLTEGTAQAEVTTVG